MIVLTLEAVDLLLAAAAAIGLGAGAWLLHLQAVESAVEPKESTARKLKKALKSARTELGQAKRLVASLKVELADSAHLIEKLEKKNAELISERMAFGNPLRERIEKATSGESDPASAEELAELLRDLDEQIVLLERDDYEGLERQRATLQQREGQAAKAPATPFKTGGGRQ